MIAALVLVVISVFAVGLVAYAWMSLTFESDPDFMGLRRNPDNGKLMLDGFEIVGDLLPIIVIKMVPCFRDGDVPEDDEDQPFERRAVVFERAGVGNMIAFGDVRRVA